MSDTNTGEAVLVHLAFTKGVFDNLNVVVDGRFSASQVDATCLAVRSLSEISNSGSYDVGLSPLFTVTRFSFKLKARGASFVPVPVLTHHRQ